MEKLQLNQVWNALLVASVLSNKCARRGDFARLQKAWGLGACGKDKPTRVILPSAFLALATQWTEEGLEEGEREGERVRAQSYGREPDEVTVVMGFKLSTAERLKAEIHTNM